jgi:glycosyltransferase involved in cell wall biosynthesis
MSKRESNSTGATRSVLLLEKVFLRPRTDASRGVELFNFALIRDLSAEDIAVTIPTHPDWRDVIQEEAPSAHVEILTGGGTRGTLLNGLIAAGRLARRRFDVLYLGNVANSLIPSVRLLFATHTVRRCVMTAHRAPSARFLWAQKRVPTNVSAVNGIIADAFREAGFTDVQVRFGVPDAARFSPPPEGERPRGEPLNFCVLGFLDNPWKGADTAIDALRHMAPELRAGVRLHLASYANPPVLPEEDICLYTWMEPAEIPAFLRRMDVMIVPSRDEEVMRETFCLAAVQGMLTGLPLLVSDLPVLKEKVQEGGGIIFTSVPELTQAMEALVREPERIATLGREARSIAERHYCWDPQAFIDEVLFPPPP